jgi:hypothetical protein
MKSWQSILINGCITVVAVIVAMGIFVPDAPPDQAKEIRQSLNNQFKGIELKLAAIEDAILKQKEQEPIASGSSEPANNPGNLNKLDQKLDMILGKLSVLESRNTQTEAPQSFGPSSGPPMAPGQPPPAFSEKGQGPVRWIDSLPDDKKREVEIIFEENAIRLRENLPSPNPDGTLPNRNTVMKVMKENDLLLKQELKTILTDEEYQQFLDAHPNPVVQTPSLSGTQENQ